jgi:hypothetical protein
LKFNNNETGNAEFLTIQVQPDNSFQIRPPKPVNNQSNQGTNNLNVAEIKERVSNNFADSFLNGEQELINRLLECYNVENNTIDIVSIA